MKMSIEVGHGWCGALARCPECDSVYTLTRQRNRWFESFMKCPECKQVVQMEEQETPWVGMIEEMVDNE